MWYYNKCTKEDDSFLWWKKGSYLEVMGHSMCSITELKKDPNRIFQKAETDKSIYVLRRNEPIGVIISVQDYEHLIKQQKSWNF